MVIWNYYSHVCLSLLVASIIIHQRVNCSNKTTDDWQDISLGNEDSRNTSICTDRTAFENVLQEYWHIKKYDFDVVQKFVYSTNLNCKEKSRSKCKLKHFWSLKREGKKEYYNVDFHATECWKLGIIQMDGDGSKEVHFRNAKDSYKLFYRQSFEYNITVVGLPTGDVFRETFIAPTLCNLEVIDDIQAKITALNPNCATNMSYASLKKEFVKFCNGSHTKKERREKIRSELEVTDNCNIFYRNQDSKTNKDLLVFVPLAVAILSLVAVLSVCVVIFKTKGKKKRNFLKKKSEHKDDVTNVMIVHRPGCEYLDDLVDQLSNMLKSYGLSVNIAFGFDDVSAEGGIVSYLQHHIQACDYVVVFITKKNFDKVLIKHRPYEFSLRLMEGMFFHDANHAQFIPVYLTTYKRAVSSFPSFLKAVDGYGYRVPDNVDEMVVKKLCVGKHISKDQLVKNKLFLTDMKESSKRFLQKSHPECNSEHCDKGTRHTSTANLSSFWATTKHSAAYCDSEEGDTMSSGDHDLLMEKEKKMSEIQYQKTLTYVQTASQESDATDKTDLTSLESIEYPEVTNESDEGRGGNCGGSKLKRFDGYTIT